MRTTSDPSGIVAGPSLAAWVDPIACALRTRSTSAGDTELSAITRRSIVRT
jgi:hypothetical protein